MLAASGCALLLAGNQSIAVSYTSGFTDLGQGDIWAVPVPGLFTVICYAAGSFVLNLTAGGRTILAVGGNEDASRLMGLQADRVKFLAYFCSGGLAGLSGVILASQFGAGQPIEVGSCLRSLRWSSAARS
jgi:ribose/xylose/arabinose/galactoside ABC-type transport system permease subunit